MNLPEYVMIFKDGTIRPVNKNEDIDNIVKICREGKLEFKIFALIPVSRFNETNRI